MRLCQCLGLVIAASVSGLSAGILELPLFFPRANPDNVLSPPHSYWRAVADEPVVLYSRLSGDRSGSVRHSGSNRASTSLCIEPDTPDLSQKTGFPGCLPLPEDSERVLVSIADNRPDHQQTIWTLPVGKMVLPVNTTISETSKETSILLLPCDQEPCVVRDYEDRVNVLDFAEMTLSGESGTAGRENRKVREVVQTRDQNGNIIYQWYDQDGHLHTISEWEFKRRLSMYFQSLLEFLYPEYFGSSIPPGGGWHQWQYRKVRRTADRPENIGQQRFPARQTRHQPNGHVAAVPPVQQVRSTKYHPRHKNNQPQPSPSGRAIGKTVENEIDRLLMEFTSGHMQSVAARYKKNYDGRKHGQYCSQIKNATRTRRKPLTDDEKLRFVPFMRHLSEVVHSFNERNVSTCVHSLVASQLLYPSCSIPGQRTASGGEVGSIKKAQKVLIEQLARAVESRATLQERAPCGFNAQEISNLLWALAKLVENKLLQLDQDGLANQAVMALLPQVVTPPEPFNSQNVSNLLWALAKLVGNGLLQLDQDGLAIQAVTELLPQVQSHQDGFTSQHVSNLLWALAKLVENRLLQLDQDGLAIQTVMALLPQVQSHQDDFISQGISNLLWALAKLVENELLQLDQGGLASQTVAALLRKVVTPPEPFDSRHVSNLLWALAKLVEDERLQQDQGGLASQAMTTLLLQVPSHQNDFTSQGVSNLLWALAKLVENGLLQQDQGRMARHTVTALLSQVVTPPGPFNSQHVSNLLWALAKLVENRRLQLDQGRLTSQVVTALLSQVVTPPGPFNSQHVSNLLWSLAKLMENGLLQLDQGGLARQSVTALLPQVVTPPGLFKPQEISNLLWALAKLVENGRLQLDQDSLASQAVTALLLQVVTPPGLFKPQEISNLLWALAKLVENGRLQLDQDSLTNQAVMALLPQVVTPPGPFKPQEISNLLWALAKLVENGQLQLDQGGLASQVMMALLPQVQSHQGDFTSQGISNLLWVLAKLVENGLHQQDQGGLASQTVTALLPQVVTPPEPFNPQQISNLLWALAKLVENGQLQLYQGDLVGQAVTALLPQVQSHQGDFTSQGISNLLWALAALGDGVSLNEVVNIFGMMDIDTIELRQHQEMTLWALTVFLARGGETSLLLPPMKRFYDALMAEKGNSQDIRASIMWLSGIWLEENRQGFPLPDYEITVSPPHRELYKFLRENFPRHALEMEASVNGLPPVDLLFPRKKVVVEVQGAHHYTDKEKKLRNGSTILKTSTYEKLGYKVFEIPASDVTDRKKREQLLRELDACFLNRGNSANSSTESDYETTGENNRFSAEEKP